MCAQLIFFSKNTRSFEMWGFGFYVNHIKGKKVRRIFFKNLRRNNIVKRQFANFSTAKDSI